MMNESRKEAFYSDLVTLILILLVIGILVLLLSFSLPGDRLNAGLWLTGSISTTLFYCLRGRFTFWVTLGQIMTVGLLTAGEIWVMGLILAELEIIKGRMGVVLLLVFLLGLFCINKQAIEYVFEKWGIKKTRNPVKMV